MPLPQNTWQIRHRLLDLTHRPLVLGIVNVTPDSFSDGGRFATVEAGVAHGLRLVEQGADMLDVGGESSRPGAQPVPAEEELARVLPVIERLAKLVDVPISIDTYKAATAQRCLDAGAAIVNDITGLGDPEMARVVAASGAGLILMHMQGTPATMQQAPHYDDVMGEVRQFFQKRLQESANQGIAVEQVVFDPGIGFGKKTEHNLTLLARLAEFQDLGRPIALGVSRKGLLGRLLDRPLERRLAGSLAVASDALSRGAVQVLRVHDVEETRDAVIVLTALRQQREQPRVVGGGLSLAKRLAQLYELVGPRDLVEIAILAVVIFCLLRLLGKTRGSAVVRGLGLIAVGLFLVAQVVVASFDLTELSRVLDYLLTTVLLALVVIFQPELRRGLIVLGRYRIIRYFNGESDPLADKLADAADALARECVGALIVLQREMPLDSYAETGERIDGEISASLIRTIFKPGSPLHDGAVILANGRLTAAACQLPLNQPPEGSSPNMGMRHRAAACLSDETDAVVLVVSEETGRISVGVGGKLEAVPRENLSRRLAALFSRPAMQRAA